jgi:EAL domain-containing protein (putative c-di-GMP-specific phosphodiesterase class I)
MMTSETRMQSVADFLRGDSETSDGALPASYQDMLFAIRSHLGMDVAFISEFSSGRRYFRHVESQVTNHPVSVGASDPLEESFCQLVVDGRLPELIRDATALPAALKLPVTRALPIGAHLSVPIRLKDGRIYGMFCCASFTADQSLTPRDLTMMRVFADLAARQIDRDLDSTEHRRQLVARIETVLAGDEPSMVYQPIYDLEAGSVAGFESLARFTASPHRTPDVWFTEAAGIGLGVDLEIKAARNALSGFNPDQPHTYVSINISAETILSGKLAVALDTGFLDRVVLEITEHTIVTQYKEIAWALGPLRSRGLRLAVDDAGAGYASFRHILALRPDLIKLDISLTRDIDIDHAKGALAIAMVTFAQETDSTIVAEGVETRGELNALRELGIAYAQGYLLGRPAPHASAPGIAEFGLFEKRPHPHRLPRVRTTTGHR